MAAVENVEWLNQNLLRAYPIRENADTTPRLPDGAVATGLHIPTCLITDFTFTLAFDAVDGTIPSLTGLSHAGGGFSLEISLGDTVLSTITVNAAEHTLNKAYRISGSGDNADCAGWIVLGDLDRAADEIPEGVYRFDPGQVPFEVSTLRIAPRGIRSITAVGKYGLKTYAPLYGNVRIIAGSDMSVRNDSENNAIWLQAESQTGYERTEPCQCGTEAVRTVQRINGMSVDSVTIIGDSACIDVTESSTAEKKLVKIADRCSTPCCGCNELNFVESAIATINKSMATLQAYANELNTRLGELYSNREITNAAVAAYPTTPST